MSAYSVSRVRRSLTYFVIGKSLGIVFGIGLLLTLVRALDVDAYRFYIISQALLIIINQISSFGFEPTVQRFLPELLSRNEGITLYKITIKLFLWRFVSFIIISLLIYPFADYFTTAVNLAGMSPQLRMFLIVVIFELFSRFLDIIFDSFLMQGVTQISMLLRAGLRLIPVIYLTYGSGNDSISLNTWIMIDIVASITGSIWGATKLWEFLRKNSKSYPGKNAGIEYKRYFNYAMPIYIAGSIMLVSGQDVIKLIAARLLPAIQFASFGFALTIISMFNRYLPMNLLVGMIRPLFVEARQRTDYKERLPMMATLVFKLNIFALLPIIVFITALSNEVTILLTAGRYPEAGNYMIALMPVLVVQTMRSVISLTALALENARAPLKATLLSLIGLIVGIILSFTFGAYGFCFGLVISGVIYNYWVLNELRVYNLEFNFDWFSYIKMTISALLTGCMLLIVREVIDVSTPVSIILLAILTVLLYLILTYIYKPFSDNERDILNKILKRRIFVW